MFVSPRTHVSVWEGEWRVSACPEPNKFWSEDSQQPSPGQPSWQTFRKVSCLSRKVCHFCWKFRYHGATQKAGMLISTRFYQNDHYLAKSVIGFGLFTRIVCHWWHYLGFIFQVIWQFGRKYCWMMANSWASYCRNCIIQMGLLTMITGFLVWPWLIWYCACRCCGSWVSNLNLIRCKRCTVAIQGRFAWSINDFICLV